MQKFGVSIVVTSALILSSCSTDTDAITAACSAVRDAIVAATPLSSATVLADDQSTYIATVALLDAAHEKTDDLSRRQRRRLVEQCDVVSELRLSRFRQRNSQRVAADLIAIEALISEADAAVAKAKERQAQVDKEYPVTASKACKSLEKASATDVDSAVWVLGDLESAVFDQRYWSDKDWARFELDCPLVRQFSMDQAVKRLERIVASETSGSTQSETAKMLAALAEMELAWNSISSGDRAVVCSRFRQNGVVTAQEWVRASGYGRPEYAFAFLSQAC